MKKSGAEHLGKKIKKIRAFNGMTQEELALAINKTRSMVSHIERTGEANYYTLKEIARVLNLPLEKLQDNEDTNELILNKVSAPQKNLITDTELIQQLKQEIKFLKDTIVQQQKLIFQLTKKRV
ncbi:MAG: helix-turn-helix transcriptional regulator [Chitinophagales bacterium]